MKKTIIVGDGSKRNIQEQVAPLQKIISEYSDLLYVDLKGNKRLQQSDADVIITLGGDGTVLRTSNRLQHDQIPILGINLGKLGFLTSLEQEQAETILPKILQSPLNISTRMRLHVKLWRDEKELLSLNSLNDAVITRGGISRMVSMDIRVNDEQIAAYEGDGLVMATPTGSTAHNLSAGGPILSPGLDAMVLTPLAPHTLTLRPLVVPDDQTIDVFLENTPKEVVLTSDGQYHKRLQQADHISITASDNPTILVLPPSFSYYETLNKKLDWGKTPLSSSPDS